jgi:hypothetical protein
MRSSTISHRKTPCRRLSNKLPTLRRNWRSMTFRSNCDSEFAQGLANYSFYKTHSFSNYYKEVIAQIQEFVDVGISVKGTHYPGGKEPRPGQDRKLYLFLEARDELSLRRAKEEVVRIMRETLRMMVGLGWGLLLMFLLTLNF